METNKLKLDYNIRLVKKLTSKLNDQNMQ